MLVKKMLAVLFDVIVVVLVPAADVGNVSTLLNVTLFAPENVKFTFVPVKLTAFAITIALVLANVIFTLVFAIVLVPVDDVSNSCVVVLATYMPPVPVKFKFKVSESDSVCDVLVKYKLPLFDNEMVVLDPVPFGKVTKALLNTTL